MKGLPVPQILKQLVGMVGFQVWKKSHFRISCFNLLVQTMMRVTGQLAQSLPKRFQHQSIASFVCMVTPLRENGVHVPAPTVRKPGRTCVGEEGSRPPSPWECQLMSPAGFITFTPSTHEPLVATFSNYMCFH